ncbi:uncharacterized protein [Musca autumnalis]|uniref:uncharacterized protein n=1 Tax=Musca autumnalis TaxID=221902 RepID=UPI003CE66FA4
MDIHSICRICLESLQNDHAYNLFLVVGLKKKLCMCTALSVEENDKFPKNICEDCYNRLNDMADFQRLCADSVKRFQELLANHVDTKFEPTTCDIEEESESELIDDVPLDFPDDEDDSLHYDPLLTNNMSVSKRIPKRQVNPITECQICHQKFKKNKNYEKHMELHNVSYPSSARWRTANEVSQQPMD